jgi:hypothetical protein
MLNNLTNFFNLIKARMIKTTLENADLIATGTRDTSYGGTYKPTAITYSDLRSQIAASLPPSGVAAVTGTSPVVSSGGTTPAISMPAATNIASGHLTASDWNTFNNKQAALVSGTNIKTVNSTSLLGSGDVTVQPTLVSGTNIKTINGNSILGSGNLDTPPSSPHVILTSSDGANRYTNTVNAASSSGTTSTTAGVLGLTPFIPKTTFTTSGFSILVTSYSGANSGGRVLIYDGGAGTNMDNTVSLVGNFTIDITAAGILTIGTSYQFLAGRTYWLGWNCTINLGGASTLAACSAASMAPLTVTNPISQGAQLIGYNITSFPTSTPPASINLAGYSKTATGCVQIFWGRV